MYWRMHDEYFLPTIFRRPFVVDSQPALDVIYNTSLATWACCGGGGCANHTNETFDLAAPDELIAYFHIPSTGGPWPSGAWPSGGTWPPTSNSTGITTSTSTSTTSTSTAASATSTTTTIISAVSHSTSQDISKGEAAGIGVGVAVAVVALAAVLWYMILVRERRRRKSAVVEPGNQDSKKKKGYQSNDDDTFVHHKSELSAAMPANGRAPQTRLEEMPADPAPQELQA